MNEYFRRVSEKVSKLSDEQVKDFLNAVAGKNDMFDSIFESLSTGLIIVDEKWKLIFTNKAAERYLPFSIRPEESKSESVPLWRFIDDSAISEFLEDCFQNNRSNVSDEFTTATPNGAVRFIVISVLPLVKQQEMTGSIVTVNDITEKRNQEILLHRMENLAGLTNLAAGMAHEIKNPLGAISIHVQLIQKALKKSRETDGMLPDEKFLEKHLDVVNEEIDNLNKKVMDFLMAVRPVNAKLELIDVDRIIHDAAAFITPEFHNYHIMVHMRTCKNTIRLLIDEKLFKEVLINIAQNAIAAIQERFPDCGTDSANSKCQGMFEITTFLKDDKYIITISDNGIGMSEETASHVFEPYFTTKANGTGLGMTMVYKIIKEFKGDIQIKSILNEGTIFTITLPVPQTDRKLLTENTRERLDEDSEKIADKMAKK
ncbi:MAG TPA: two-component sensor histidine kinase [Treponema sp.]|nr:two-component sensor histidine kinase [Treponema sp.]